MSSLLRKICLCCLSLSCVAAIGDNLKEIRLYPSEKYTRLVFEMEELVPYRLAKLQDPARLVLDVYSKDGEELLTNLLETDLLRAGYLKKVRFSRFDNERLRVVFDLAKDIDHSLFSLDPFEGYGHRVVLDVSPKDRKELDAGLLGDLGFSGKKPIEQALAPKPRKDDSFKKSFVVVIDAGHGGEDPGATSKGLHEKHIVLDIAQKIKLLLDDSPGIEVLLTRNEDVFLPLATRVRLAHKHGADLFMSIHADSYTSSRPKGSSVFVLSKKGASSKFALALAKQENLADMVGGINTAGARSKSLDQSLSVLFKDGKERASRQYAEMAKLSLAQINSSHGEHIHSAGFAVLKSPSIPSVLIEVGFLSNPEDAKLLAKDSFRQRLAEQIAASVLRYSSNEILDDKVVLK